MKRLLIFLLLLRNFVAESQTNFKESLRHNFEVAVADSSKIQALGELVDYYSFNQFDSSLYYSTILFNLSERIHYRYGAYLASFGMFHAYNCTGNYAKALGADLNMMKAADQLKQSRPTLLWVGHYFQGVLFREMNDFPNSFSQFRESLRLADSTKVDRADWFASYSQLALLYKSLNKPDSALRLAKQGYWLALESKEFKKFACLSIRILGNMYELNSQFDSAERFYRLAITESIRYHNAYFLTGTYNYLASYFLKRDKTDSCIHYAESSFQLCAEHNFGEFTYDASSILKSAYQKKKNADSPVKYLQLMIAENDSMYNQENVKKFQSYFFDEELNRQERLASEEKRRQSVRFYYLAASFSVVLLVAFILYRSNRQKQKANRIIGKTLNDLKAAQTRLVLQEKMASLGELTAGIAHEIQNPLNFVNNFSEINDELMTELKSELLAGNTSEAIQLASTIQENEKKIVQYGRRADGIVKGMQQHSRTETGEKELVDLNAIVEECLKLSYRNQRAKDNTLEVQIITDFESTMDKIHLIPQDILRALVNLFNNAFYAVSEKKKERPDGYVSTVSVATHKTAGRVFVSIKDNGNGIPKNIRDKIFQPFFTTKPTGQGTGLGLSLSYDIIKVHGGELMVASEEGKFTEFTISLPA